MPVSTDGHCPQCLLKGESYLIQLNRMDYWECPNCNLQMQMLQEGYLGILTEKGEGALKNTFYNFEIWGTRILVSKPLYFGDKLCLNGIEDLKSYLSQINFRNSELNPMHYKNLDQIFVCKCPKCNYPVSMPISDIEEVPNDYLQCSRCLHIFNVSKIEDFHKLTANNFSPEELEYFKGIIPANYET